MFAMVSFLNETFLEISKMQKILKSFVFLFSVLLLANNVFAATVATNIDGVVIKVLRCIGSSIYSGSLVNRTDKPLRNITIAAKTFDRDGDPVGDCAIQKSIGANSGDSLLMEGCNCEYSRSVVITIK